MKPEGRLTIENRRVLGPYAYSWTWAIPSGDVRLSPHVMNDRAPSKYECWWIEWKL